MTNTNIKVNPEIHLYDAVIPAYENYVDVSNKEELKKFMLMNAGLHSASLLFHFREVLEPYFQPKELNTDVVGEMCSDYQWVRDVTNAFKHTKVNRQNPILRDRTAIEETIVQTYFPFPNSIVYPRRFYSFSQTRIMITPLKGEMRDLLEITTNVLNFWTQFLIDHSFSKIQRFFRYDGDDIFSPEDAQTNRRSTNIHLSTDGIIRCAIIARYYEPSTKTFGRWGFTDDGLLVSKPIKYNAPNAKIYGFLKPE